MLCISAPVAAAEERQQSAFQPKIPQRTLFDFPAVYKKTRFKFFPIPVFETDPAVGQRYGLMPTLLWLNEKDELVTIGVGALTYNPKVVKLGGFGGLFLYPSAKETLRLFYQVSQHFEKDYYLQYTNATFLDGRLKIDTELEYYQNPFERFFGFGPDSSKNSQTNFVSHVWFWKGKAGYEFWPRMDLQLEEKWVRMTMHPRAILSIADTQTAFAGNASVASSDQWVHRMSWVWDTRDNKDFPANGHHLEPQLILSQPLSGVGSFNTGYELLAKKFFTVRERFTTLFGFRLNELFGDNVPFFMQPSLGGEADLRGFIQRRFIGKGSLFFNAEERILVKRWSVSGVKFDFSMDPFFSVGQVFDRWGEVQWGNLQPVGGVGFRAKALPAVIGRVDVGFGREGMEVYTGLDYPF